MKKSLFLFLLIFLLGLTLRFIGLGNFPVGLHRDEAFLGYNAYSIMETGRDMSGNFLPLHLQSFIFSPAGYSYFSIPFIYLFGLSAFSVRFASAFFSSLTILITFFLTLEIFGMYKNKEKIGLLSAFFISISPWNINLGRTATESSIVVFFISSAALLFLVGLRKNSFLITTASFICFSLTLFIYQAPRAFLPLFIPAIFILYLSKIKPLNARIKLAVLFVLLIVTPVVMIISSKDLSLRLRTLSVFSSTQTSAQIKEYISGDGAENVSPFIARVFHNKFEAYSYQIIQNYFKHFSFDFLFTDQGFPDRYRIPSMGLMYIFDLPLLLFGIWEAVKNRGTGGKFLIAWVLLAPVGSALTFDDIPNLQRTLIFFPALSIIVGLGANALLSYISKYKKFEKIILATFLIVIIYSFTFYLHQYYVHGPRYRPWYRQDGYAQLVPKVNSLMPGYKKAVITNSESAPSVFFLFFSKYNPATFQKETKNSNKNTSDSTSFSNYIFSDEQCPLRETKENLGTTKMTGEKGVLYVNDGSCAPTGNSKILDTIYRKDESRAFVILSLN